MMPAHQARSTGSTAAPVIARRLEAFVSRDPEQVLAAQKLRYTIFSEEYDSDLGATNPGVDSDHFDNFCDHLLVLDVETGTLVATSRVLHQQHAIQAGGFYSEGEFDLNRLLQMRGTLAELGRTCVHPDYRSGATISLLWTVIADYLVRERVDFMIGCASISMADGGLKAWRITEYLRARSITGDEHRVFPARAMPHPANKIPSGRKPTDIPPLIKAYMRMGARVCGEPCWDPEFRCADLLVLLDVQCLAKRYSRRFMQTGPTHTAEVSLC